MGEARSADGHFIAFCERSDQKASRVTHARSVRTEYEYGRYIYNAFFLSNASAAKRLKKKAADFVKSRRDADKIGLFRDFPGTKCRRKSRKTVYSFEARSAEETIKLKTLVFRGFPRCLHRGKPLNTYFQGLRGTQSREVP